MALTPFTSMAWQAHIKAQAAHTNARFHQAGAALWQCVRLQRERAPQHAQWDVWTKQAVAALRAGADPFQPLAAVAHIHDNGSPALHPPSSYPPLLARLHDGGVAPPASLVQAYLDRGALADEAALNFAIQAWPEQVALPWLVRKTPTTTAPPSAHWGRADPLRTVLDAWWQPSETREALWVALLAHPQAATWQARCVASQPLHAFVHQTEGVDLDEPTESAWLDRILALGVPLDGLNEHGETALGQSHPQLRKYVQALCLLVAKGAQPSVHNHNGDYLLNLAIRQAQGPLVQALISAGVDLHQGDANDTTPLHEAIGECHPTVVKVLLEHGAPVNATNVWGVRPLELLMTPSGLNKPTLEGIGAHDRAMAEHLILAGAETDVVHATHHAASRPLLDWFDDRPAIQNWLSGVMQTYQLHRDLSQALPVPAPTARPRL